jgi:alpha-L-rhamnosidase
MAGIDTDGPGYQKLIIAPCPPDPKSNPDNRPIFQVQAEYDSPHGKITVYWVRVGGQFRLNVTIPANTTATIEIPTTDPNSVRESGHAISVARDIKMLAPKQNRLVVEVPAGSFSFGSALQGSP